MHMKLVFLQQLLLPSFVLYYQVKFLQSFIRFYACPCALYEDAPQYWVTSLYGYSIHRQIGIRMEPSQDMQLPAWNLPTSSSRQVKSRIRCNTWNGIQQFHPFIICSCFPDCTFQLINQLLSSTVPSIYLL